MSWNQNCSPTVRSQKEFFVWCVGVTCWNASTVTFLRTCPEDDPTFDVAARWVCVTIHKRFVPGSRAVQTPVSALHNSGASQRANWKTIILSGDEVSGRAFKPRNLFN